MTRTLRPREAVATVAETAKAYESGLARRINVETLLGDKKSKLNTMAPALKCWAAFCKRFLRIRDEYLPPSKEHLVTFSILFRCADTYANHVSAIRLACQVAGLHTTHTYGNDVRRATAEIMKRAPVKPANHFLLCQAVSKLTKAAIANDTLLEAMLYLLA